MNYCWEWLSPFKNYKYYVPWGDSQRLTRKGSRIIIKNMFTKMHTTANLLVSLWTAPKFRDEPLMSMLFIFTISYLREPEVVHEAHIFSKPHTTQRSVVFLQGSLYVFGFAIQLLEQLSGFFKRTTGRKLHLRWDFGHGYARFLMFSCVCLVLMFNVVF